MQQRDGSTTTWIHSNGDPSISTFTNWPGATEVNSTSQNRRDRPVATATEGKVPSQRSFQKTKNGNVQWGFSIDDDSEVLQWTKLELMPREPAKELATLKNLLKGIDTYGRPLLETAPRQLTFNAQDVIEDYLGKVVKEWVQAMNRRAARALENIDVDVVITYPAVRLSLQILLPVPLTLAVLGL